MSAYSIQNPSKLHSQQVVASISLPLSHRQHLKVFASISQTNPNLFGLVWSEPHITWRNGTLWWHWRWQAQYAAAPQPAWQPGKQLRPAEMGRRVGGWEWMVKWAMLEFGRNGTYPPIGGCGRNWDTVTVVSSFTCWDRLGKEFFSICQEYCHALLCAHYCWNMKIADIP